MELYNKHLLKKSFGLSLCLLCWTTATLQFIYNLNTNNAKMVNAFLETSSIQTVNINKTTTQIILPFVPDCQKEALDIITNCFKKYDKNIKPVLSNNAGNYYDFYFYSPLLNKNYGINTLPQGSNIHIAVTNTPVHIYIGIPYIDYDF